MEHQTTREALDLLDQLFAFKIGSMVHVKSAKLYAQEMTDLIGKLAAASGEHEAWKGPPPKNDVPRFMVIGRDCRQMGPNAVLKSYEVRISSSGGTQFLHEHELESAE